MLDQVNNSRKVAPFLVFEILQELATKTIVTAVAQVTEVIYDPLEDTVVVTIGTERILLLDNHGQVLGSRLAGVHVVLHDDVHGNHNHHGFSSSK